MVEFIAFFTHIARVFFAEDKKIFMKPGFFIYINLSFITAYVYSRQSKINVDKYSYKKNYQTLFNSKGFNFV